MEHRYRISFLAMKTRIQETLKAYQDSITETLLGLDSSLVLTEDTWQRKEGGGGITRVLGQGRWIEQAGVNFSCVYGKTTQTLAQVMAHQSPMFFATGLSIVIHPKHPYVPIIHMNVRYFEMTKNIFWFGVEWI